MVSGLVVDKRVVGQPLDGAARCAGNAEGVPGWQQVRELDAEFVFEAAEGSLTLNGPCQPEPWSESAPAISSRSRLLKSSTRPE